MMVLLWQKLPVDTHVNIIASARVASEPDPFSAMRGGKGLAHTSRASSSRLHRKTMEEINEDVRGKMIFVRVKVTSLMWGMLHSQWAALSMSYQQLTLSIEDWLHVYTPYAIHEWNKPQISDVTFARTKIILARAWDWFIFLHGLLVCAKPFPPWAASRVKGVWLHETMPWGGTHLQASLLLNPQTDHWWSPLFHYHQLE